MVVAAFSYYGLLFKMPKIGSLLLSFLMDSLNLEKYINLKWVDEEDGKFVLECPNKHNKMKWSQRHERIYEDWDKIKKRFRHTNDKRSRFIAALKRSGGYIIYSKSESTGSRKICWIKHLVKTVAAAPPQDLSAIGGEIFISPISPDPGIGECEVPPIAAAPPQDFLRISPNSRDSGIGECDVSPSWSGGSSPDHVMETDIVAHENFEANGFLHSEMEDSKTEVKMMEGNEDYGKGVVSTHLEDNTSETSSMEHLKEFFTSKDFNDYLACFLPSDSSTANLDTIDLNNFNFDDLIEKPPFASAEKLISANPYPSNLVNCTSSSHNISRQVRNDLCYILPQTTSVGKELNKEQEETANLRQSSVTPHDGAMKNDCMRFVNLPSSSSNIQSEAAFTPVSGDKVTTVNASEGDSNISAQQLLHQDH